MGVTRSNVRWRSYSASSAPENLMRPTLKRSRGFFSDTVEFPSANQRQLGDSLLQDACASAESVSFGRSQLQRNRREYAVPANQMRKGECQPVVLRRDVEHRRHNLMEDISIPLEQLQASLARLLCNTAGDNHYVRPR